MAHIELTIQLKTGMTWRDLRQEVEDAEVPEDAKVSTYHYDSGGDPREYSYTNLIFSWDRPIVGTNLHQRYEPDR